jgi:hypothetical protein
MWTRSLVSIAAVATATLLLATWWIASPSEARQELAAPLRAWSAGYPTTGSSQYAKDLAPLMGGFRSQAYRSFCGPASISTVLRAYGVKQVDQSAIFSSFSSKLSAFYTGMSLAELSRLAGSVGLQSEIVYADKLDLDTFRERLKSNLRTDSDFVLVNYDRRLVKQSGAGHISPVAAYDETQDAFLVLDEAAYKYPFTWIPTPLLYAAVHTRDGDRFRGVLLIRGYVSPG